MSSKIYSCYKVLKNQDMETLYLFKSGIFYIFLSDDAIKMAPVLNLKLTDFCKDVLKCGFPVSNSQKFIDFLKDNNFNFKIIDDYNEIPVSNSTLAGIKNQNINSYVYYKNSDLVLDFLKLDIDTLSLDQAFYWLNKLQLFFKNH